MTCCIGHQTTHTRKLFNLLIRTTGTGVSHHKDVVVFVKTCKQRLCQSIVSLFPCINNFFVTFFFCNKTTFEILCNQVYGILCLFNHFRFLWRHCHIRNGNCHGSSCGIFVSHCLNCIQHFCCLCCAMCIDNFFQNLF